jgi:hypothetical protein
MDIPVLGCWNELDPMSQMPQRRPYVSRTASFASGADSPVQALEECLTEIDRREAAVGAFTVIDAAAARAAAEASAERCILLPVMAGTLDDKSQFKPAVSLFASRHRQGW